MRKKSTIGWGLPLEVQKPDCKRDLIALAFLI